MARHYGKKRRKAMRRSTMRTRLVRGGWRSGFGGGRSFLRRGMSGARGRRFVVSPAIQPKVKYVRFKSCQVFNLTTDAAAGTTEDNLLRLNDPYDPYLNLGGSAQPLGFDQWMAFYKRGRCVSWNVRIKYLIQDISRNLVLGLMPEAGPGGGSSPSGLADTVKWTEWCEYPRAKNIQTGVVGLGGNTTVRTMYQKGTPGGYFQEILKGSDAYDFTVSAGPSNIVGLHLLVSDLGNVDLPDSTTVVVCTIELTQVCKLYDRINLAQSVQ